MGDGYRFKCKECGHEYNVFLGIGFMFPEEYRKTVEEASTGKYGEEWKQLMNSQKYMDIDAEEALYTCDCGGWKVEKGLSIYAPIHPEKVAKSKFGIKTVEEWGYVPYVMHFDRPKRYKLVKEYKHMCDKCEKEMHKVSEVESPNLSCPKCGCINATNDKLLWD